MASKYKLTELQLKALSPRSSSYMVSDGAGLNIKVYPNGRMQWVLRKTSMGKAYQHYLGDYPAVTLKEARTLSREQSSSMPDGRQIEATPQFASLQEIADDYIGSLNCRPSSVKVYLNNIKNLAPLLSRPIETISSIDARRHLMKISSDKGAAASKLAAGTLAAIEKHAYALGLVEVPRFSLLASTLPKHNKTHFRSTSASNLPELAERMNASQSKHKDWHISLFLILCFTLVRTKEAGSLTWSMVDFNSKVITIPSSVMKANREHRVPISSQLEFLLQSQFSHSDQYILRRAADTAVSRFRFAFPFQSLGISDVITPHGVRSMARSWFADQGFDFAAAELCLAHKIENSTQMAYQRSDYLERRRDIMQAWCDYVTSCLQPFFPHLFPACQAGK